MDMIEKVKEDYGIKDFFETSALTGFNTTEVFVQAAKILAENQIKYKKQGLTRERSFSDESSKSHISLKNLGNESSGCKC